MTTIIDFNENFNFDDLTDKWVLAYRETPAFELSGKIVEIEPSSPGNLNEGWVVTIDNPEYQYYVKVTTKQWTIETSDYVILEA